MKKLLNYIMTAVAAFALQSCLHEDTSLFDESAAQRIDNAAEEIRDLLEAAPDGWLFEYYLGGDYSHGGFNFLVKFENGKVSVSGEIAGDNTWVETSSYDIAQDQGPVISFNTYNEIFHYLCQPYPTMVDGFEGDFEFVVLKAEKDYFELKGKKWGNHMYLTRIQEGKAWQEILDEITNVQENILFTYQGTVDGKPVYAELDDDNHLSILWNVADEEAGDGEGNEEEEEDIVYEPFIFTGNGIKTRMPFEFGGHTFQNFVFDTEKLTLASVEEPGIVLNAVLPEGYKFYSELDAIITGKFSFSWYNGLVSKEVTIAPNESKNGWVMSGLNANYDIQITYNKVAGAAYIFAQKLGTDSTGDSIYLACWDLKGGGNLTWSTEASVRLELNEEENGFAFVDGGTYPGLTVDSFILWAEQASGQCSDSGWYPNTITRAQMPYLQSLTKL